MQFNSYLLLMFLLLACCPGFAQVPDSAQSTLLQGDLSQQIAAASRVNALVASIDEQRAQIKQLAAILDTSKDVSDRDVVAQELGVLQERLVRTRRSLEQLVIGGIDTDVLVETADEKIVWQEELQQILLPVLAGMRELTAKPRRVEALRNAIEQEEGRLSVVRKALDSATQLSQQELSPPATQAVQHVVDGWRAHENDLVQSLDLLRVQLVRIIDEQFRWREWLSESVEDFVHNRGVTLLLAGTTALIIWLVMHMMLALYGRLVQRKKRPGSRTRLRLAQSAYHGVTLIMVVSAVVAVFYLRSDILLFTLSIISLVFLALTLRQLLPRFITETRLLLNMGSVREGERVLIEGVPFEVKSINVHCLFRNPALRGLRRLPLSALHAMVSRPSVGDDESWFPTDAGDWIVQPDGVPAQVESQTIDFVELRVFTSLVTVPVIDFIGQGFRNISRDGFALVVIFGIDYQHQDLIHREVPNALEQGVRALLENAGYRRQLQDLVVEFREAAASSLNLQITARFNGDAAHQYSGLSRLIQRACVRVCSEKAWVIPFDQLTLHSPAHTERVSPHPQP